MNLSDFEFYGPLCVQYLDIFLCSMEIILAVLLIKKMKDELDLSLSQNMRHEIEYTTEATNYLRLELESKKISLHYTMFHSTFIAHLLFPPLSFPWNSLLYIDSIKLQKN